MNFLTHLKDNNNENLGKNIFDIITLVEFEKILSTKYKMSLENLSEEKSKNF